MKFNFIKQRATIARKTAVKRLVTVKNFFESEDNRGYIKPSTFLDLTVELIEGAPALLTHYHNFFLCVQEGHSIRNVPQKRTHLTNQEDYYFIRFRKGNMLIDTIIYEVEGLGRFISDYANGLIETDFTLEDLIDACKKH